MNLQRMKFLSWILKNKFGDIQSEHAEKREMQFQKSEMQK
jgi:hypothetical protein